MWALTPPWPAATILPDFVELNALCTRMQNMNTVAMTVAAVCLAVLALAFLVLACLGCGRRAGTDGVRLLWMDYIPLELHTAIIAAAIAGLGSVICLMTCPIIMAISSAPCITADCS